MEHLPEIEVIEFDALTDLEASSDVANSMLFSVKIGGMLTLNQLRLRRHRESMDTCSLEIPTYWSHAATSNLPYMEVDPALEKAIVLAVLKVYRSHLDDCRKDRFHFLQKSKAS